MNKKPYCRYCKEETEMELEHGVELITPDDGNDNVYWYECPMCGTQAPISNTPEGALEYAVNGYA